VAGRGSRAVQLAPADLVRLAGRALAEADKGPTRPITGQTFALDRAADAHRAIEARTGVGKTLLTI
jgi:NADPH:quinone reductase